MDKLNLPKSRLSKNAKSFDIHSEMRHEAFVSMEIKTIFFTITPNSPLAGRIIKDLCLPEGVCIKSIKRGYGVIIPHRKTVLNVHDRISVTLTILHESVFREWLKINVIKNSNKE